MNGMISGGLAAAWLVLGAAGALAQGSGEHDCGEGCDDYSVAIRCRAVNDFGYVASARGSLRVTGGSEPGRVAVSGTLRVNTKLYGEADNKRRVQVEGTVDVLGHFLSASVASDDELTSMLFGFVDGASHIEGQDGTQYQTECSSSRIDLPLFGDLMPSGTLRFTELDGQQRAQIDVINVGNFAVSAPQIGVRFGELEATGSLVHPFGGNALVGGDQGYIEVDLPAFSLSRCTDYTVAIDLDQQLQSGPFHPYANDEAVVTTPCLRWDTPITADSLGSPPDALIQGLTLGSIISSDAIARADGLRCSTCHYAGSGKPYSPPAGSLAPTEDVGGRSWAQIGGWLDAFNAQTIKPEYLKQALLRWRADGAR